MNKKKSVLICEENYQAQELYAALLAGDKITSYFCPTGVDPITHARRLAVDGIILSLDPMLDERLVLISRLSQHAEVRRNPLLVITAQVSENSTALIRQHYAGYLLLKPFPIYQFQKIIKESFIQWWSRGESNP